MKLNRGNRSGAVVAGARIALAIGVVASGLLGAQPSQAAGAWADAGPHAGATLGSCAGTSTRYRVFAVYQEGYYVARQQTVGGKCKTTLSDFRPYTQATIFKWSPDLTSAEIAGPSDLGNIHIYWTAKPGETYDPVSYTGAWTPADNPAAPLPAEAGVWAELARASNARGNVGAANYTSATFAYLGIGGGGGVYS